jgi:hypothetical protein
LTACRLRSVSGCAWANARSASSRYTSVRWSVALLLATRWTICVCVRTQIACDL